MVAEEVATFLQEQGYGTLGTNIFLTFPNLPDDAISVSEYPGEPPVHVRGRKEPSMERPRVQVLVRSKSYRTARARAERIFRLLNGYSGPVSGVGYALISAVQSPFFLSQDEGGRYRIVANYSVLKELSPVE